MRKGIAPPRKNPKITGCKYPYSITPFLISCVVLFILSSSAIAEEAYEYFRDNCYSCHTIGGGRLTGPDLKDLEERRDREWSLNFIQNPKAVVDSGDPYAQEIFDDAGGVLMPAPARMTHELGESLLDLIAAESKLEESEFAGLQIPDGPFSQNDINHGYNYFMGFKKLENGGPSCVSCHTVRGIPSFGGGRFGPDLTKVYERLEGRVGLVMWMSAPATTTMQPIFEDHPLTMEENLALVAYLEDAAQNGGEDSALGTMVFFLVGMGGMLFGLALFSAVWFRRFKAVRRPLVEK